MLSDDLSSDLSETPVLMDSPDFPTLTFRSSASERSFSLPREYFLLFLFDDHDLADVIEYLVQGMQVAVAVQRIVDQAVLNHRDDVDEEPRGPLCERNRGVGVPAPG